jgi:hypothetical protein
MQSTQLTTLTGIILGLEFAAFGWRVNREINVGEGDRKTWLPLPDVVNIVALLMVVYLYVVVPLAHGDYTLWSRRVLAAAGTLIAFHPLVMAAHYGLPYRKQRPKKKNGDFQYAPTEEVLTLGASVTLAILAARSVAA